MSDLILLQIVVIFILLFMSAFFSGAEIAIFSVNKIRIKKLAEEGSKDAIIVDNLLKRPNKLLATILVGNNIVNITAAAIATSLGIRFFQSSGVGLATGVITFLVLVFGEITPKAFAQKNSEKVSLLVAKPIEILESLLYPIAKVLVEITKPLINAFGGEANVPFITGDEIKMLMELGEKEGVIQKEEKEMIAGIFEFGETTAKEVMLPRMDMDAVEIKSSLDDALKVLLKTRHSRLPVYEGNIDNVIGVLNLKDLLHQVKEHKRDAVNEPLREIIRPAYLVPESKKLDELLKDMQKQRIHMAIVVDEYGGTAGLVTMEDLLEEIVGEILDEYDAVETNIQILDEKNALVEAKTGIEEVNNALDTDLPEEEFETIGGLIFDRIGKVPVPGEKRKVNGVTIVVESMRGRRISKVKIIKEN